MKLLYLILLLILLRLLNDIKEKWSPPSKSFITKDLTNCNNVDQQFSDDKNYTDYRVIDGIKVAVCNFGNTFVAIGKTFDNVFHAIDNTIDLGEIVVDSA